MGAEVPGIAILDRLPTSNSSAQNRGYVFQHVTDERCLPAPSVGEDRRCPSLDIVRFQQGRLGHPSLFQPIRQQAARGPRGQVDVLANGIDRCQPSGGIETQARTSSSTQGG